MPMPEKPEQTCCEYDRRAEANCREFQTQKTFHLAAARDEIPETPRSAALANADDAGPALQRRTKTYGRETATSPRHRARRSRAQLCAALLAWPQTLDRTRDSSPGPRVAATRAWLRPARVRLPKRGRRARTRKESKEAIFAL